MRTCWEIREELSDGQADGKPQAWLMACADCPVRASDLPCWAQCSERSCCAPIHVTCDFCALYIEHRREISERMQSTRETPPIVAIGRRHDYAGGMPGMEKTQFSVPEMWADHHVLRVRQALTALPGVQDVVASSAFRAVALSYDPAVTSPEAIADALAAAGYPIAGADQGPVTQPVPVADGRKDPAWDRLGFRVAHTDPRDARK